MCAWPHPNSSDNQPANGRKEGKMKLNDIPQARLAWILWNLHERLNALLWERYEREFLDFILQEEQENQPQHDFPGEIEF
jgi:hypothetical protein